MKALTPLYLIAILLSQSCIKAEETELLSAEKQSVLHEQQNKYKAEHQKLRYNWISPLNLKGSYSYDKSASGDYHSDLKTLSGSISQDIFRSGGIVYQIEYADAKVQTETIALHQQIATLNNQLFTALLNYRKKRYELEQSTKKIDNYDIEIFIKRHLFDAGKADITELNNALMNKSVELKTSTTLRYEISRQRLEIAKLSDIDPDTFVLPVFTLVKEEEFLKNHLDLRYARSQNQTYESLYNVTQSSYLPSIAINGSAGYQEYDPKELPNGYSGNFYSAGVSITLPLTYNASAAIQESKAAYLKQAAESADIERTTKASYAQSLELIESYRHYIAITRKNLSLYEDLITATKAGYDAGTKTGYDFQTITNSKAIEEYTIKINEINIQLELSKLHFAINASKETL
ncbi:TolC family protein [Sulfuricurvum sp.]|uniref:TolC family protein n=1 Tax=Sulfuricurvum sp. TaxID=2025608 RepID=UPI003C675AAF